MTPTTTAVPATAMEISDRMIDRLRRLLVVAVTIAALLAVWAGAAAGRGSVNGQASAFRWLQPALGATRAGSSPGFRPAPQLRLPEDLEADPYRLGNGLGCTDRPGADSIRGYLNATPRQGTETLAELADLPHPTPP